MNSTSDKSIAQSPKNFSLPLCVSVVESPSKGSVKVIQQQPMKALHVPVKILSPQKSFIVRSTVSPIGQSSKSTISKVIPINTSIRIKQTSTNKLENVSNEKSVSFDSALCSTNPVIAYHSPSSGINNIEMDNKKHPLTDRVNVLSSDGHSDRVNVLSSDGKNIYNHVNFLNAVAKNSLIANHKMRHNPRHRHIKSEESILKRKKSWLEQLEERGEMMLEDDDVEGLSVEIQREDINFTWRLPMMRRQLALVTKNETDNLHLVQRWLNNPYSHRNLSKKPRLLSDSKKLVAKWESLDQLFDELESEFDSIDKMKKEVDCVLDQLKS